MVYGCLLRLERLCTQPESAPAELTHLLVLTGAAIQNSQEF